MNYGNNHCNFAKAERYQVHQSIEAAANSVYNKVAQRGLLANLKRFFGYKQLPALLSLDKVKQQIRVYGHEVLGEMSIDLDSILGTASDGRAKDFDVHFRPMQLHNKERWLSVAGAWISGRRLGRVKLVQLGDIFFVEDGHHRISVAKAMGERVIAAEVVRILYDVKMSAPSAAEQLLVGIERTPVPRPT